MNKTLFIQIRRYAGFRSMVRMWREYVTSVGWLVNTAFLASILFIIMHDFSPADSSTFSQVGENSWELGYRLALALVGSYVFFYLNIHLPRLRDKRKLRPFWRDRASTIYSFATGISRMLARVAGETLATDSPATEQETLRICGKVNPHAATDAKSLQGYLSGSPNPYLSVLERMYSLRLRTKQYVEDVYTTMPFVEAEFLQLVNDIEKCTLFFALDGAASFPMGVRQSADRSTDMTGWALELHDYFEKARRLRVYIDRKLDG